MKVLFEKTLSRSAPVRPGAGLSGGDLLNYRTAAYLTDGRRCRATASRSATRASAGLCPTSISQLVGELSQHPGLPRRRSTPLANADGRRGLSRPPGGLRAHPGPGEPARARALRARRSAAGLRAAHHLRQLERDAGADAGQVRAGHQPDRAAPAPRASPATGSARGQDRRDAGLPGHAPPAGPSAGRPAAAPRTRPAAGGCRRARPTTGSRSGPSPPPT